MDFALTEEQQMFQKMVRDFANRELVPVAARIDETEEFPAESVRKMGELGLFGIAIDEKYGGMGGDHIHLVIANEEIARACAATCAIYQGSRSLGINALYRFGNEEQKQRFIPPLARGEKLACLALTEPNAGSDPAAIETTAKKDGKTYILNGRKIFISNGAQAETAVVFATLDKTQGHRAIAGFIIEKGTPGFSVGKKEKKLGIRGCSNNELIFDNCVVPEEQRLGEEGRGFRIALETITSSRICVAAQAVGIARAALEASLNYAKERRQFGQPIVEFQAIQWMLADMATNIDAARLLVYRAAYLDGKRLPFMKEASMAKVFAAEAAMHITTKAIQIHGGYGYMKDFPVERYFRDAKITEIYEGTSEMQRLTIARALIRGE